MSVASSAGAMSTEELFRQHAAFVMRFLRRLGVPAEQVDDALQEVFLVVHRNGGYRPGAAKPTSYLANIAIHAATKHRRRERVERMRHSEASLEHLPSERTDPARAVQTQEDLERLQSALDCLPDALRTTLVLVELEGESCLSVAAAMAWPVGTVYWRLFEARKKFQAALRSIDAQRADRRMASVAARSERRRALRVPSLGMFAWFGSSFERSEARRLLRVAREEQLTQSALESLLARHRLWVQSGANMPVWAANYAPHAVSWLGLLGPGATGAIVAALLLPLTAAVLLRPEPAPMRAIAPASRVSPPMAAVLPKPVVAPSIEPVVGAPKRSADVNRAALPSTPAGSVAPLTARPHPTRAPIPSAARATNEPTARAAPIQPDAPQKPANESELAEMHDIGNAERLIATDPARALAIADDMRTRFPHGYFREERSYVEVMSLIALRRFDDARAKADDFLRTYPDGPYSRRIRHALERGVH